MSRKNMYLASQKKSEYRQNFLPFDYYDFCITAKENENLRCRNKLRDYLHTPFDWDEDLDILIEPVNDNFNQATQTAERPVSNRKQKQNQQQRSKTFNELKTREDEIQNMQDSNRIIRDRYLNHYDNEYIEELRIEAAKEAKKLKKAKKNKAKKTVKVQETENNSEEDFRNNGIQINVRPNSGPKKSSMPPKMSLKRAQSTLVKSSTNKSNADLAKEIQMKKTGNYELLKNSGNQAIQTPHDWTLRDYNKPPSRAGLYRSASAANVRPKPVPSSKPPPFAMYGSGVKTKDMSFKPTHNNLANKTLARNCDRDAMLEVALNKLKKQANNMANEYSVLESYSAEKFRTGRSESREWNSEYDERYPDHSRSASRNEIYYKENPYRLNKSTLNVDYPVLKRGASAGAKKIYFYE